MLRMLKKLSSRQRNSENLLTLVLSVAFLLLLYSYMYGPKPMTREEFDDVMARRQDILLNLARRFATTVGKKTQLKIVFPILQVLETCYL